MNPEIYKKSQSSCAFLTHSSHFNLNFIYNHIYIIYIYIYIVKSVHLSPPGAAAPESNHHRRRLNKKMEEAKHSSPKVEDSKDELHNLIQKLEHHTTWDGLDLVKYEGIWCATRLLKPIISAQKHFNAKDSDIILSTMPKSGTTWLKALTFAIVNRNNHAIDQSPLLKSNPHKVVPALEFDTYKDQENPDLEHIPSPRIFSTHISYNTLPNSIRESKCRVIYICRNPLDLFNSLWHFLLDNKTENYVEKISVDEAFDSFCEGNHHSGPFWAHMLGYWNAYLADSQKVLFLKYEDLKEDIEFHVKKIAEFIGFTFSVEEEEHGVMEQISRLCSFENLSNLDVNKKGSSDVFKNSSFFRKGEVGDWKNHLTPAMGERVDKLLASKLEGSGLMFKTCN